jgi:hypothetical protein
MRTLASAVRVAPVSLERIAGTRWLVVAGMVLTLSWTTSARAQLLPQVDDLVGQTLAQVGSTAEQICKLLIGPGAPGVRFVDNGDGTVSDFETGLMWEKKVEGSSGILDSQGVGNCLNCVDDDYAWATAMSEWISALNGRINSNNVQAGFAGHTDWRLPTSGELLSIRSTQSPVDCPSSCIDPIFGLTKSSNYWSSSTFATELTSASVVHFFSASPTVTGAEPKSSSWSVRAVRGSSN